MIKNSEENQDHRVMAVIVTYNPSSIELDSAVNSVLDQVDFVLVIDNGSEEDVNLLLSELLDLNGVNHIRSNLMVIRNLRNPGISVAYNTAINIARAKKFEFLLILDQDSEFAPGSVARLLRTFDYISSKYRVGAICAKNVEKIDLLTDKTFLNRHAEEFDEESSLRIIETTFAFNSGMMIPVKVFDLIGDYDERFFLDCVDQELCLRLRKHGLRIFIDDSAVVYHEEAEIAERKFIFSRIIGKTQPAFRYYYISRDTLRTVSSYARYFPVLSFFLILSWLFRLPKIILFQNDKGQSLRNFARGIVAYFKNEIGPIPK